jgi:hypothetical protein
MVSADVLPVLTNAAPGLQSLDLSLAPSSSRDPITLRQLLPLLERCVHLRVLRLRDRGLIGASVIESYRQGKLGHLLRPKDSRTVDDLADQ